MKFLEVNIYLRIYLLYLAKEVEQNFIKQSFLVNKKNTKCSLLNKT